MDESTGKFYRYTYVVLKYMIVLCCTSILIVISGLALYIPIGIFIKSYLGKKLRIDISLRNAFRLKNIMMGLILTLFCFMINFYIWFSYFTSPSFGVLSIRLGVILVMSCIVYTWVTSYSNIQLTNVKHKYNEIFRVIYSNYMYWILSFILVVSIYILGFFVLDYLVILLIGPIILLEILYYDFFIKS